MLHVEGANITLKVSITTSRDIPANEKGSQVQGLTDSGQNVQKSVVTKTRTFVSKWHPSTSFQTNSSFTSLNIYTPHIVRKQTSSRVYSSRVAGTTSRSPLSGAHCT